MSRRSTVRALIGCLVVAFVGAVDAAAQGRMASSPQRMQPTAPSAGAAARTPAFRQPWEGEGVPISNDPPCDSDECRRTTLVRAGSLSPELRTKYMTSRDAAAWLIDCDVRDHPPESGPKWTPRHTDEYQTLDAEQLQLESGPKARRLWFKSTVTGQGIGSQCFRVRAP